MTRAEETAKEVEHEYQKALRQFARYATQEQIEGMVEDVVNACPNLFVVARGLRAALQDDWERAEVAELLMEGVEK